jgi:lysine biosynthesis protein LysW
MKDNIQTAKCPLCGEKIKFTNKPHINQSVICPACDAELKVVGLRPLSLDWPYDDEEYFDYDDEEEDLYEYEEYED